MKQGRKCKELDRYKLYGSTPFLVDDEDFPTATPVADVVDANRKPILMDILISAEVLLPQGEDLQAAKVLRRSLDENEKLIEAFNDCPLLSTLVYDIELLDGAVKKYDANIIAENLLS